MTLDEITTSAIDPALRLLPRKMDTLEARVQMLTTGLQESGFLHRRQLIAVKDGNGNTTLMPMGPAKSFWMGERGGGLVRGVRRHPATADLATAIYKLRGVRRLDSSIWNAIEGDDVLAAALARLLIYTDPWRVPALGDHRAGWAMYIRTWRPGKPREETWPGYHREATAFVLARRDL